MSDLNLFSAIGLAIRLLGIGVIVFYVIPKQFSEVLRPKDWLTGLRWQILLLFVFSIVAAIPSLIYQYYRSIGHTNVVLQNISAITGNLSTLGTSILIVLIYNYKRKE